MTITHMHIIVHVFTHIFILTHNHIRYTNTISPLTGFTLIPPRTLLQTTLAHLVGLSLEKKSLSPSLPLPSITNLSLSIAMSAAVAVVVAFAAVAGISVAAFIAVAATFVVAVIRYNRKAKIRMEN